MTPARAIDFTIAVCWYSLAFLVATSVLALTVRIFAFLARS